jgi:hypothetical protein
MVDAFNAEEFATMTDLLAISKEQIKEMIK